MSTRRIDKCRAKSALKQLQKSFQILPVTRRKMLYERLRTKIANDITTIMGEQGCSVEELARRLKLKKSELRKRIWENDLKLSELTRLLDHLDSELYPIIRSRKKGEIHNEC